VAPSWPVVWWLAEPGDLRVPGYSRPAVWPEAITPPFVVCFPPCWMKRHGALVPTHATTWVDREYSIQLICVCETCARRCWTTRNRGPNGSTPVALAVTGVDLSVRTMTSRSFMTEVVDGADG
jgi:hypothetical protein